jgi:hypothetical protein
MKRAYIVLYIHFNIWFYQKERNNTDITISASQVKRSGTILIITID